MKKSKKVNTTLAPSNKVKINLLLPILVLIAGAGAFMVLKNILIIVFAFLICALLIFLQYVKSSKHKGDIEKAHENEFVDIINYFEMFLANDFNIYQSFQEVLAYSSPWMRNKIETLLISIDEDKSVKPFISFAKNFKNGAIENVMISIYQMIDDGHNNVSLSQFNLMFDKFEENNRREIIYKKESDLQKLNVYPLVGAIITTLILTFSILSLVGEMTNGY